MTLRLNPVNCHCAGCDFCGTFPEAVTHHHETGHAITFRGMVQDLSAFTPEKLAERRAEMARPWDTK